MANLTLAEARIKVAQLLDDPSNVRWSTAQIDDALADCLSACLTKYARSGGDRFDLETTGTTSATTGALSISSVSPLLIRQVSVVSGDTAYRLPPKDRMRHGTADLTARSLRVLYVREYALPTTTSHPLVGVGATEANSWRAFDRWICAEAAVQLAIKEVEEPRLARLERLCEEAESYALERPVAGGGYPIPRPEWSPVFEDLQWSAVMPSTIYLTRRRW